MDNYNLNSYNAMIGNKTSFYRVTELCSLLSMIQSSMHSLQSIDTFKDDYDSYSQLAHSVCNNGTVLKAHQYLLCAK